MSKSKWNMMLACRILVAALVLVVSVGLWLPACAETAGGSSLIGVLITKEDLSPLLGNEGVLWATVSGESPEADTEYTFEGVNGIRLFYFLCSEESGDSQRIVSKVDDEISAADFSFSDSSNGSSMSIDGAIYFVPEQSEADFYYNPVMQAGDGRVFAIPGDAMAVSADMNPPGSSLGQALHDERKHTEKGVELIDTTDVNLELRAVRRPLKISLLQFDKAHEVLKVEEYAPDTVPEQIVPLAGTDYVLLETDETDLYGSVYTRREVFGREDDSLYTLARMRSVSQHLANNTFLRRGARKTRSLKGFARGICM